MKSTKSDRRTKEELLEYIRELEERLDKAESKTNVPCPIARVQPSACAALEALTKSEDRLRAAQQAARIEIWERDLATEGLHWTPALEDVFGLPPGSVQTYRDWADRIHFEDAQRLEAERDSAIADHQPFDLEYRVVHPSGEIRWLQSRGRAIYDNEGRPTRVVGVNIDVTDRVLLMGALLESEQRLMVAKSAIGLGIFDYDIVADVAQWDLRARELWGVAPDRPVNWSTFVSGIHSEDRARVQECFERATSPNGNGFFTAEFRVLTHHDRSERWILVEGQVFFDKKKPVRMVGVMRNVSARNRRREALRLSEERLRLALHNAHAGIWDWNPKTNELFWSEENNELFGRQPEAGVPAFADLEQWIHPEDVERVKTAVKDALSGRAQEYRVEFRFLHSQHGTRWCLAMGHVMRAEDGSATRMLGINLDITAQKKTEAALIDAKEAAEAANSAKDAFIAALSHELRTPLTPVLLLAGAMEHNPDLAEHVRKDFSTIRRNIAIEAQLIDDLLGLTELASGKVELDLYHADVHEVVRHCHELLRLSAEEKNVKVKLALKAPTHVFMCDPMRIRQIIWNILSNAIKFTPSGGSVIIRSMAGTEGNIRIEVTDTGIGMTKEELHRAFHAFAQGDHIEQARRFGGLGLGLSISGQLAEMHRGCIWAESEGTGQGTTFILELPLRQPARASVPLHN